MNFTKIGYSIRLFFQKNQNLECKRKKKEEEVISFNISNRRKI